MLKDKLKNIVVFLLSLIILYLIYPNILYEYFVYQMPFSSISPQSYFADWTVIISATKCNLQGYDVFLNNPCDFWGRKHVYGSIFLFMPFNENLINLYNIYIPIILNILFILIINFHFDFNKNKQIIYYLLFVFSPSTLLAIERFNSDILIFLILVLICYLRSNFLKLVLLISLSIAKFYPLIASIVLLFKGINKKNIIYFFSFFLIVFTILFIDIENIIKIFQNRNQFTASYKLSFGLSHFSSFPNLYQKFSIEQLYILSTFIFSVSFLLSYAISKLDKIYDYFTFNNISDRVYVVGSSICIFTYLIFSNYIYREIFIFFILPFLFKTNNKSNFSKIILFLILLKYLIYPFTYHLSFFYNNDSLNIVKSLLDNLIVSFMLGSLINILLNKSKLLKTNEIKN